jgi:hypothetical protein
MSLSTHGYSLDTRVPFTLGYRIGLAILIATASYVGWLSFWMLSTSVLSIAALFGDRASATIVESPLQRFGDAWQWVMGGSALLLILLVLGRRAMTIAAAIAWVLSLVALAFLGAVAHGFNWVSVPILCFAFLVGAYATYAVRRAA